ncbi:MULTISPECIES: class-II fumarase/aspartase family protein [Marinomonas]|uniref:Adenylosuccinate lyase family protein n=1 Tax=Marinomonas rhodophyticola TaxID=2992803 RepID=A0ABT3KJL8_9GAMM|nr:adenylosuccinate lyase family protein [Marinomonas sp. KJ51-3]MCW4630710.1 adenylosuccinate lyase family protein [Marinomonas sp. KJ51-3]
MSSSIIDSKLFAPLFLSDAMNAVFSDKARVQSYVDVEAALARAQASVGMIPQAAADAINRTAETVSLDMVQLAIDTGNVGYPILGLVRQLSGAAGDAGRFVHWGATTQDIMDTGSVLQIRNGIQLIEQELTRTLKALSKLAETYKNTVMAGRTHMQHALPITFGYKAAIWLDSLIRCQARLQEMKARVLVAQLGGASGTLASMGKGAEKVTEQLAKELDLQCPTAPWHATRDNFAEIATTLAILSGSLAKVAFDIMIMSMTELGEVSEPFVKDRGASSTMPQKRNPISCEVIRGCHKAIVGNTSLLLGAQESDLERATGPWHAEWIALPQVFVLTHCALSQASFLLEGLEVHPQRMLDNLYSTNGLIMAESAMMTLAPYLGRQEAHDVVYDACRIAEQGSQDLAQVLANDPRVTQHLTETAVIEALKPENYLGLATYYVEQILSRFK